MNKVTFMFGSGSVENAWTPVTSAMKQVFPRVPEGTENLLFAHLVYQLRELRRLRGVHPASAERLDTVYEARFSTYRKLMEAIACELRAAEAEGQIRVREQVLQAIVDLAPEGWDAAILTTNWDTTIDKMVAQEIQAPRPEILHVHGSIEPGSTLYLPSETVHEPYRSAEENAEHAENARHMIKMVGIAQRLVVYGLSFDPLDVELALFTAEAFADTPGPIEIHIIDRDPERVERRLRAILYNESNFIRHQLGE